MLGFFKQLLRKPPGHSPQRAKDPTSSGAPAASYHPEPSSRAAQSRKGQAPAQQNGKGIELPVQSIIDNLPLELQPRIRRKNTGDLTITVPLEKILAQLSRGAVRISFGELRQAVPDVFTTENDRDRVLVALPLSEILARLNPALITRRRVQRQVQVPSEISSPFDGGGQGLVFSAGPKDGKAASGQPAPHGRQTSVAPPSPKLTAPSRSSLTSAPVPAAPGTTPPFAPPKIGMKKPAPPAPAAPAAQAPAPASPGTTPPFSMPRIGMKKPGLAQPPASSDTSTIQAPPPAPAAAQAFGTPRIAMKKPAPAQPAPAPAPIQPAAAPAPTPPLAARPAPPLKAKIAPPPAPARPAAVPVAPPAAPQPKAPVSHPPLSMAPSVRPTPKPEPVAEVDETTAPESNEMVPAAPVPVTPPPQPAPVPKGPVAEPLMCALTNLAEGWPEAVRKEILEMNLVEAKVALPMASVEQALKQGRIVFSWKTIRSWIKPAVLPSVSAHDGAVLELPLRVIAPLFLARQRQTAKPQHKVAVDEEIPNLFFGFPQAETGIPVAQATARPSDTNFYVWDDSSDMVKVHEAENKRGPGPGTKFVAKYATPNEVVSRASALDGVAGAVIALPDGLMVANRLPPELNPDTLAAFLPQIFGKVSQCTKELRMGELNNLNFTVGNVPWKIFRVNAIFFAAFGKAGEPLPTGQLAALASELDHKPK